MKSVTQLAYIVVFAMTILVLLGDSHASASLAVGDTLVLGVALSEQSHAMSADLSQTVTGGLGEPARILMPRSPQSWEGGRMAFTLKVDPAKPNYVTVKLWGSDVSDDILILYAEGKQVGYRHLGDIDVLDIGNGQAALPGRFYYATSPLPLDLTTGKTEVRLEIRSTGRIWGYGSNWDQYQKPMTAPTRGVYCVYSHTDACFSPGTDEKQGDALLSPPVRQSPGPEVLDAIKARVNKALDGMIRSTKPLNQQQMHLVSRAYFVKWTVAYRNPAVADRMVKSLDALYVSYRANPQIAQDDPAMYNGGWFGLGFAGAAVKLLADQFKPVLDDEIDNGAGQRITRRAAWSEMLQVSRDFHRANRRQYTNQSMIVDLNTYAANEGVTAIDPAHASPNGPLRHFLYQSLGMEPWLGSDTPNGPAKPLGDGYFELTSHQLTKELGFVGYYGEVLDWATSIYDITRPAPDQPGDPLIEAQIEKIAHARAVFRYPATDVTGNRAFRAETIVGWRDAGHYPGDITYVERPTWDASPLALAAATLDPQSVGGCQQMLADNQFFSVEADTLKDGNLRVTNGLLDVPDQYASIKAQQPSKSVLPMTAGQPDFVWADEEDGVVAIKHGEDMLYASLYWRARSAINFLARVHLITPKFDRIGVVREEEQFEPSGQYYTRPDWVNMGFGNGGMRYPGDLHSAEAGEKLPIAKGPAGVAFKPGDESPYAGRAEYYHLRYGNYLIGMNATADKSFSLDIPADAPSPVNIETGERAKPGKTITVSPHTTLVFYLGYR